MFMLPANQASAANANARLPAIRGLTTNTGTGANHTSHQIGCRPVSKKNKAALAARAIIAATMFCCPGFDCQDATTGCDAISAQSYTALLQTLLSDSVYNRVNLIRQAPSGRVFHGPNVTRSDPDMPAVRP